MNNSILQSKETLLPQKEEEYKIDKSAEEKAQELENDKKKEDIIDQQINREERQKYANKIYELICTHLILVFFLVFLQGGGFLYFDNSVLITILSTTTADILGLFAIVIHYLFPNKK